ncbi:MAG: hypothetical protein MK207_07590 [Saprospiraceae bacterium]|nr:hypothetical protein [Saprospiraceae bacterium]
MKKVLQLPFSTFLLFFLLVSCDPNPCDGINCDNGVCDTVTGTCLCIGGYEQDTSGLCTIQWTTKMAGNYTVSDSCTGTHSGSTNYPVTLTPTSPKTIDFSTLGSLGTPIMATHNTSSTFIIDTTFTNGTILTGTGSLIDTNLIVNYIVNDTIGGSIDTCLATFSRL